MQNVSFQNYLHLHLIVFIWGFTAILGALISLDALPLVWFRMVMATLFVMAFLAIGRKGFRVDKKSMLIMLGSGLIIALHWITFFKAIKVSNVSVTLGILSTGAFFTSILEPIFYKRKFVVYELLFGLMVVAGLWVIFRVETRYMEGIWLALLSALLSSLFSLVNGKLARLHASAQITAYELLGGVLFLSAYLLATQGFHSEFFSLSASDWMYLLILASVCTAYAFIASVKVLRYLSPFTVMLTINLEPVYGILLATLIFNETEKMSPSFYLGASIILLTVVLNGLLKSITRWKTNQKEKITKT